MQGRRGKGRFVGAGKSGRAHRRRGRGGAEREVRGEESGMG